MAISVSEKADNEDPMAPADEVAQEEALKSANIATDEEAGSAVRGEEEIPAPKVGRSTKLLFIAVSILLVVAVVIVSVLLTYDGNEESKSRDRDKSVAVPNSAPTSAPAASPSQPILALPTAAPQAVSIPTSSPTATGPTASPTTSSPSSSPSADLRTLLVDFLVQNGVVLSESDLDTSQAVEFLVDEAAQTFLDTSDPEKLVQRYAMVTLDYALRDASFQGNETDASTATDGSFTSRNLQTALPLGRPNLDECLWIGVTCFNGTVVDIKLGNKGFAGSIPSEIGLMTALTQLDLSHNDIGGFIPEELYRLTDLEFLFLYQNQLTGTISSSAGNWWNMSHLHLSHNQLTGSIPSALASDDDFKVFKYVNLKSNRLSGSIPSGLRWPQLLLLDLGFNQLTGTLPSDLGETFGSLRHLYLDHNQFVGTLPDSYITVGNRRLEALAINDNLLTGAVPDNHEFFNKLVMFTMENNDFSVALGNTCRLTVFNGGENVEIKADCNICSCTGDFACANC